MVKALHAADIEVILDVVYNHTAEGNHLGPTLAFRGHRQRRLLPARRRRPAHYYDTTGTGNSLLMRNPHVLQLIMDSLRYWVTEMHVDGFRFDLAATLARQFHEVDRLSAFFDLVQQDPVVSQVKLIAEPWDVGDGGYQVGNFPPLWTEWNGKYRDTVRDFWRGEPARSASSPRGSPGRATSTSTTAASRSRRSTSSPRTTASRCATSCPTTRSTTRPTARTTTTARATTARGTAASRARPTTRRSAPCGCASSATSSPRCCSRQGVPMLLHGDELGRTQGGNNNVYCQDNEISWVDWDLDDDDQQLLAFTAAARRRCAASTPSSAGAASSPAAPTTAARASSATSPGSAVRGEHDGRGRPGHDGVAKPLMVFLNGQAIPSPTRAASRVARRLRSSSSSTPTTSRGRVHAARRGVRRATGSPSSTPAPTWSSTALDTRPAAAEVQPRSLVVLRCPREVRRSPPEPPRLTGRDDATAHRPDRRAVPTSTYRLQLARRASASTTAAAQVGLPRGARRLAPLPLAGPAGGAGLDARLRRRRPHPDLPRSSAAREAFAAARRPRCREAGLGIVVDVVPNHMTMPDADAPQRAALVAAARRAGDSPYAAWFDVDWDAEGGRILMPVLGGTARARRSQRGDVPRRRRRARPARVGAALLRPRASRSRPAPTTTAAAPSCVDAQHYRLASWLARGRRGSTTGASSTSPR